jgi:MATE family multidrug resistance protein
MADESVFQILMLMSAWLTKTDVAAMGIFFQWYSIAWGLWWGLGLACQVRVGTNLGADKPRTAKRAVRVSMWCTSGLFIVLAACTVASMNVIAVPFSSDKAVISVMAKLTPIFACAFSVNMLAGTSMAALEGMARMTPLTLSSVLSSFLVTLPMGYVLAFVADMGTYGLALAPVFGDCVKLAVTFYFVWYRTDWHHQCHLAMIRSEHEHSEGDNVSFTDVDSGDEMSVIGTNDMIDRNSTNTNATDSDEDMLI